MKHADDASKLLGWNCVTLLALLGFDQINWNQTKYWFLTSRENRSTWGKTSPCREEKVTNSTNIWWRDRNSHPSHTVGKRVHLPLPQRCLQTLYYLHILTHLHTLFCLFISITGIRVFQTGGAFVGINAYYDTIHCLPSVSYRIGTSNNHRLESAGLNALEELLRCLECTEKIKCVVWNWMFLS